MKRSEEIVEILEAFDLTGSYRAAAELAGCDHHRWPAMSRCAPLASRRSAYLPGSGVDDRVGEVGIEGCGELAGAVADEEPEGGGAVGEAISRLRACWVVQAPVGWLVVPRMST